MRPSISSDKNTDENQEIRIYSHMHCKKRLAIFPSPAGMSLIKLQLAGKNLIIPDQGEFGL
jgi:hypothetical protein